MSSLQPSEQDSLPSLTSSLLFRFFDEDSDSHPESDFSPVDFMVVNGEPYTLSPHNRLETCDNADSDLISKEVTRLSQQPPTPCIARYASCTDTDSVNVDRLWGHGSAL
jgi:hypothetical protein